MTLPHTAMRGVGIPRRTLSVVIAALMVAAMAAGLVRPADAARVRSDLERRAEERFLLLHDDARGSRGALAEYRDMREVARDWSDSMADRQTMGHNPNFATQICCHTRVGENVATRNIVTDLDKAAVDRAVDAVFDMLMASQGHRDNILNQDYRQVGIGVTLRWDGREWDIWATMVFRAPDGSEPASGIPTARDITDTCGDSRSSSFSDVPPSSAHADTVACIERAGITGGKGDGTYGAKDLLSRGQVATFLLRTLQASGVSAPSAKPCRGSTHADGMSAMIEWGIFESRSCDEAPRVGRSEMAVWSIRAMQGPLRITMPEVQWDHFFDDNNLGGSTQGSHNAIAELGVVTGIGNEKFAPEQWLRRDQMATFLARILDTAADS